MSTTFFNNNDLVTAVGNSWIGLVDSTNVLINPATSTAQTNGTQKSQIVDALGTSVTLTGTAVDVNVVGGNISIGAVSVGNADKSAFTYGTSTQLAIGGVYQDTSPTLTAGTSGAARVTAERALHINLRNSAGNEAATAGTPLRIDPTGATTQPVSGTVTANQGGAPWSENITQIGGSAITLGMKTSANSLPVVIASDQVAIPVTISGNLVTLAENIAQWGGVATSLGQKVMAASVPVVLSSDQTVIPVSQSGTWNVTNISGTISLPTGASTEATLLAAKVDLDKFTFTSTRLLTDGSGVTQPVSAASLPLPTGAATSALQTTGNSSLSSVDGKLNSLGQKAMAASVPVVLASDQTVIPVSDNGGSITVDATNLNIRALTPTDVVTSRLNDGSGNAITSTTGALNVNISGGTVIADLTGDLADLDSGAGIDNHEVIAIGLPGAGGHVVGGTSTNPLRTDPTGTTTQPVSAASLPLPAGAATSALQTTGNSSLSSVDGKLPSQGQAAMAASSPVVIASNQTAIPVSGTVTVTQATGTNLHTVVDSGTVTANIGTSGSLALDATLTGGTQKTKLIDSAGTNVATVTSAGAVKTDASATTQPISASSLPLPTGAATETTLSAVNVLLTARLPGSLGQKTMVNSLAVVLASDQTTLPISIASSAVTLSENVAQWGGVATSLGQKAMTASVPVVLASDQTVIPVSQSGTWNINNVSGVISLPTGAATETTLSAVNTKLGQFTFTSSRLVVDGSGVTQPVSGTVTANAGTGTFTVGQATGTNLHAVVDSGTVTANIGTTGGLALDTTLAKLTVVPGAALGANAGAMVQGSVTTAAPTYTTGQISPLSLTIAGAVRMDGSGVTQPVSAASLPLPTGASTEATLLAAKVDLDKFTFASTRLLTDGSGVTQPVSAASLPLPTGAATSALQTTGNSSLSSIDGKLPSLGQALAAAAVPVVLTAAQLTTLTPLATIAATQSGTWNITNVSGTVSLPTGAATSALQTTGNSSLSSIDGKLNSLGQKAMAASVPVVLASDQSSVTIAGTITANIGTAGTLSLEATQAKLTIAQGASLGSNTQVMVGGSVTTASPTYTTGQISPLSLDTTGALRTATSLSGNVTVVQATGTNLHAVVDSGTVTANAGTGSFTVAQATGTNLHAVVDSGTVTANAGTGSFTVAQATASNLNANVSGTVTANIGTSGSLALDTSVGKLNISQATALGANTGPMIQGSVTTAAPSYTTGNINPLSLNTLGRLRTDPQSSDLTGTGTIAALNASVTVTTPSQSTALFQVSGAWVATLQIQGLQPDGTTWVNLPTRDPSAVTTATFSTAGITAAGNYRILTAAAYTQLRVTATAYTSGTATVTYVVSNKETVNQPVQLSAANMQVTSTPVDGTRATYSAANLFAASTAGTDIFTIIGSSTKTVRVTRLAFTATQTTSVNQTVQVIKRSTADTGGTSTTPTMIPHDSASAAATATVRSYTANPTLGTAVGTLLTHNVVIPDDSPSGAGASLVNPFILFEATRPAQAIVLRGTAEGIAVSLGGASGGGNSYAISVEWIEES